MIKQNKELNTAIKEVVLPLNTDISSLSFLAVCHLIMNLRQKQVLQQIQDDPATFEFLEELEKMTTDDMNRFITRSKNKIAIHFDINGLGNYMKVFMQNKANHENIIWLVENGANKTLITNLFPATDEEDLKALLSLNNQTKKVGRSPSIQDKDERYAVINKWHSIKKLDIGFFEQLKVLKADFPQYDLARLNSTINKEI